MEVRQQPAMLRSMIRLLSLVGLGSFIILISLPLAVRFRFARSTLSLDERLTAGGLWSAEFLLKSALLFSCALIAAAGLYWLLKRLEPTLDGASSAQASYLDTLDIKYVDIAIVISAALSLFLELALIR